MLKLLSIDLKLFDGGDAGAEGAGGAAEAAIPSSKPATGRRGDKSGEHTPVVYGKQDSPAADPTTADAGQGDMTATSNALEDRRAEFEKLIGGDYKDLFGERVQTIIDRRFRETKTLEGYKAATEPLLALLAQRHGESDPQRLVKAIEADNSFWEEAADKAGMSVEAYKQYQKTKAENDALMAERRRMSEDMQMRQLVSGWREQEKAMQGAFPDFNLDREMENPEFHKMVRSGVPVEVAFKAMHHDELLSGAIRQAQEKTQHAVVENIRAKGQRPAENGAAAAPGVIVKSDVHSLTSKDRAEIARRVARGEVIKY